MDNPKQRTLYLNDDITITNAMSIIEKIEEIVNNDNKIKHEGKLLGLTYEPEPIKLFINSYGGQVHAAFGLYDYLKTRNVTTIAVGALMSAGIMVFLGGKKRYSYPNTRFMIHELTGLNYGKVSETKDFLEEMEELQSNMYLLILDETQIPKEVLDKYAKEKKDFFFDSELAFDYGFIDGLYNDNL